MYCILLDGSEKSLKSNGYVDSVEHCRELVGLIRIVWQKDIVFFFTISSDAVFLFFNFVIVFAGQEEVSLLFKSVNSRRTVQRLGGDGYRRRRYKKYNELSAQLLD